jgi:hypothetical protein
VKPETSDDLLSRVESEVAHVKEDCCSHRGRDEHGCWDCRNTGHAHQLYVEGQAAEDMRALVAFARTVERIHRTNGGDYCFEDAEDWPCDTAQALIRLKGS